MSLDKTKLPAEQAPRTVPTSALPAGAKTFSSAQVYKHGVNSILEITFSDTSSLFVKAIHTDSSFEVGGSADVGTGTRVGF